MHAQATSGDIVGTVLDATGAAIPNATVTATNAATGVQATATTNANGQFRISNLLAGAYDISVTAPSFSAATLKNVAVSLNQVATANVTLQVGQTTQSVTVTEAPAVIDTTTAQVQSTFQTKQIQDLPSAAIGSGVINLSLLTAGVSTSGAVGVGTGPSVGGQRPRNNNFMVEGVDNNNKSVTGPLITVPNDDVSEFTLLENQFSPEFGHSSGGQFNQIVKSGTNEFHGMAYEYMRNRNFNAADQLSVVEDVPLHPRYDNNRFGGNFGGPIKRNKLFFFAGLEYNPIGQAGSGGQIFAPTAAGYATLAGIPGLNQTNLSILKQYLPATSTAANPADLPNQAFPLVCPPSSFDASSFACKPGTGQVVQMGQFPVVTPNYQNNLAAVGSIDYTLGENDNLRARFIDNRTDLIDTAATLPAFFTTLPYRYYLVTVSEYHNFSPNITNELRLGYNRYYNITGVGPQKFPGLDAFPNVTIDEMGVNVGPNPNAPQETIQNTYQGTDNLTWTKGPHTFKFGVQFMKLISPQTFTQRSRGDYDWSTLAGYLTDQIPDQLAQRTLGNVVYYGDQIQFGIFANDDWKIRQNFTLNLGLRYERTTLPYSERLQSVNAISNVPGLLTFGEPQPQNLNFEPRIGFAYSPGTSGNTSIRGGFGINYDQLFDNLGILSLPPQFNQTVDVTGNAGSGFLSSGGIPPNASFGTLGAADARAATSGFIPNQKLPKSIQWNLGVQHVWHQNYTFEARYLGTRGLFLPVQTHINGQAVVNAQNALPLYYSMPSQATLDSLTNTLGALTTAFNAGGYILPSYANAGFTTPITAFMPQGSSTYHGLALQATRRFTNGLQFVGAYTWSHNIDNSTAEVFSTVTTPRRPEDFQNLNLDRSNSALDHRQRFTFAMVYDAPWFKHSNWFMRNIVGNWEIAPTYYYQTGTWSTVQSALDSNLNGDTWTDRAIINPKGQVNIGSGTTALKNSSGATVGYLVNNPNARYIRAPQGTLPNGGRNTEHLMPINNVDATFLKRFNVTERYHLELAGQFFNLLNHPQYIGGYLNDVAPIGFTSTNVRNFLNPANATFYNPADVFSSNPRNIQVSAKFIF